MQHTIPIAFVESDNHFYHIYVSRLPDNLLLCEIRHQIPNDYTGTSLAKLFPTSEVLFYESAFSPAIYNELTVVDAAVELCFGLFMSSPSLDGTATCFNDQWCFYSPSFHYTQVIRAETGKTYDTDRTFEQERNRYPDLKIIPLAVAESHKFEWLNDAW